MKIFVSSVITGFEPYRDAACAAIKALGYEVIRAEDFEASTKSPQVACLSGVRDADIVVLLIGSRYGSTQAAGKSATHEEYDEAKGRKPLLVFVQEKVELEPEQAAFRQEVERWSGGSLWKGFGNPEELRARVTQAVHKYSLSIARGQIDEKELLNRAEEQVPREARRNSGALVVSLSWGPKQQVLRPRELEDPSLATALHREARFGLHAFFDEYEKAEVGMKGEVLSLEQGEREFQLDELGSMVFQVPALRRERDAWRWIIEEDLAESLERCLRFANQLLQTIDGTERLTHAAIVASLLDASHHGWKTRAEYEKEPNSGTMGGMADKRVSVHLRSPVLPRQRLAHDPATVAEDLVRLLRRKHSPSYR